MSRETELRIPPHNIEAELCAIGSAVLDNEVIDEMAAILRPEDFFRDTLGVIYRAVRDMHARGRRIDVVTLIEELDRLGRFEEVGGDDAITAIMTAPPHSANAVYYAQIVAQKAASRNLIAMADRVIRDGYSNSFSAEELLERAEAGLAAVADGRAAREPRTMGDAAADSLRRFDLRLGGEVAGVTSGLSDLDALTGGFRPDQLIVLGARPGIGKTTAALNIAEHVASLYGPVLVFSLEMGFGELGDRSVCGATRTNSADYREASRVRHRRDEYAAAADRLSGLPVWIDDTPGITPSQVAAIARRMHRRRGLKLIVVDYLQIMGGDERRDSEYDRVGKAAMAMKNLSKLARCPVLALSQLSRKCEEREDKRPILSDLRATGQIEQDADVILFLYRAEKYNPGVDPGRAEVIVAKNRHGATGTAHVAFDGPTTRFSDLIPDF